MDKKFKLVVPVELVEFMNDRIRSMNGKIVCCAYGHDLCDDKETAVVRLYDEFTDSYEEPGNSIFSANARVKKSWLKEIKEPVGFEEWLEKEGYNRDTEVDDIVIHLLACHKWTLANERLKHEPKMSFEEWIKRKLPLCSNINAGSARTGPVYSLDQMKECHKWAEKNRGYDE